MKLLLGNLLERRANKLKHIIYASTEELIEDYLLVGLGIGINQTKLMIEELMCSKRLEGVITSTELKEKLFDLAKEDSKKYSLKIFLMPNYEAMARRYGSPQKKTMDELLKGYTENLA